VGIVGGGQPGADVEELADPCIGNQVPDGAAEKPPDGAGSVPETRCDSKDILTGRTVDWVVVLATQQVVPEPSRMRLADIDIRKLLPPGYV
jgi:hypothetical protein